MGVVADPLLTIFDGTNAEIVERLLSICFPGEVSILDTTYGSGMFWRGSSRVITGCDSNPDRARDICCNFTALPFADGSFDVVVYDPPFQPKTNIESGNIIETRYTKVAGGERGLRAVVDKPFRMARLKSRTPTATSIWVYGH